MAKKRKGRRAPSLVSADKPLSAQRNFGADILPLHFHAPLNASKIPPQPWQDLPSPTGSAPYHLTLDSVIGADAMQRIITSGNLVFHTVGDTGGVNETTDQENVASYLEKDFAATPSASDPAFIYHLGDVIYYEGEGANYYAQFYEPYLRYQSPILAIPGNHDGDVDPATGEKSLQAFVRNFCAVSPGHSPDAKDAPRDTLTQPNVYWTLEAPFVTIIGLYSNCPEGGEIHPDQAAWLQGELKSAPTDKALIVAVHHPIYSAFGPHPGSQHLQSILEAACTQASRIPDAVFSGHVHNYQRFNGQLCGKQVPFFIAGAGGYNHRLHVLSQKIHKARLPIAMPGSVGTLENYCDQNHGYMMVTVTPKKITCTYFAVPDPGATQTPSLRPFDTIDIPLNLS